MEKTTMKPITSVETHRESTIVPHSPGKNHLFSPWKTHWRTEKQRVFPLKSSKKLPRQELALRPLEDSDSVQDWARAAFGMVLAEDYDVEGFLGVAEDGGIGWHSHTLYIYIYIGEYLL